MNDNKEKARSREDERDIQQCCDGGNCCPSGSGGGSKSWKIVVFLIIVVAAGAVLARSLISKSNSATDQAQQSFAAIQPDGKPDTSSAINATAKSDKAAPTIWGPELDSLASLNKMAADTDAVFILLLADNDQQGNQTIASEIEAAAKKIQAGGTRISAFRLTKDAPDYAQLTSQFSLPCVLAMVKGRGASGVSGQITETKLVQAFVTASRPTSGCGPSGCGPAGCGPIGPRK